MAGPPDMAAASEMPIEQIHAAVDACLPQGLALAEPEGDDAPAGDKSSVPGTIEAPADSTEAMAKPSHPSATASTPIPMAGRPAVGQARRTPAAPTRTVRRSAGTTRNIRMLVTGYCPCRECCGHWSSARRTASGQSVRANGSRFVAADTNVLPFGSRVSVPGYHGGAAVPVLDRGSLIVGRRLDVFFRSHEEAKRWGSQWLEVTVYRG